jgi:hypothetical protein
MWSDGIGADMKVSLMSFFKRDQHLIKIIEVMLGFFNYIADIPNADESARRIAENYYVVMSSKLTSFEG